LSPKQATRRDAVNDTAQLQNVEEALEGDGNLPSVFSLVPAFELSFLELSRSLPSAERLWFLTLNILQPGYISPSQESTVKKVAQNACRRVTISSPVAFSCRFPEARRFRYLVLFDEASHGLDSQGFLCFAIFAAERSPMFITS
jgi:hypothetical protein